MDRGSAAPHEIETAATDIAMWWRRQKLEMTKTEKIMCKMNELELDLEMAKQMTFPELAAKLREPEIMAVARAAVIRCFFRSCGAHHTKQGQMAQHNLNTRVFLASYMIVAKPDHVFEIIGELETQLQEAAERMIIIFEKLYKAMAEHPSKDTKEIITELQIPDDMLFPVCLSEYVKKFKAWKIPDEMKLTQRIRHALAALYMAEDETDTANPEAPRLKRELKMQQERLRFKLQQAAGERVRQEFDSKHGRGGLPAPVQPAEPQQTNTNNTTNLYSSLPGRMTNEQLAHELLLDPDFKLDDQGGSSVENVVSSPYAHHTLSHNTHISCLFAQVFRHIRQNFHTSFWKSLEDDIVQGCYFRVARVVAEIEDGVNELAPQEPEKKEQQAATSSVSNKAKESCHLLDSADETTKWQISFDMMENLYKQIRSVCSASTTMPGAQHNKHCSINYSYKAYELDMWWDKEVKTKWHGMDMQERVSVLTRHLEYMLDTINEIRICQANMRLRLIAPIIRAHGIEYERQSFERKRKANEISVDKTDEWIKRARTAEIQAGAVAEKDITAGKPETYKLIHTSAVLALVTGEQPVTSETCPETLRLDLHRLQQAHAEYRFCSFMAPLLMHMLKFACVKNEKTKEWKEVNAKLLNLCTSMASKYCSTEKIAEAVSKDALADQDDNIKQQFARLCKKAMDKHDSLTKLYTNNGRDSRIYKYCMHMCSHDARPQQLFGICPQVCGRLDTSMAHLRGVIQLNIRVHAPTYNTMIQGVSATNAKQ